MQKWSEIQPSDEAWNNSTVCRALASYTASPDLILSIPYGLSRPPGKIFEYRTKSDSFEPLGMAS